MSEAGTYSGDQPSTSVNYRSRRPHSDSHANNHADYRPRGGEKRQRSGSRERSRSRNKKSKGVKREQKPGTDAQGYQQYSFGRGRGRSAPEYMRNQRSQDSNFEQWCPAQYQQGDHNKGGSYGTGNQVPQYSRNYNAKRSDDNYTFLSRTLASILRHNAERFGFKLMKGGFLYVDDILYKVKKLHGFTLQDVHKVVAENDKKRFALEKEEGGQWKIRANQGHTLEVECLDLKPILSADEYPTVIHGTNYGAWEMIKKTGLRKMNRNHIHFACGEPGSYGVISGIRSSCEVIIQINMEKALADGLKFFVSANGVILSEGDKYGVIYPCYFQGAIDRKSKYGLNFDNKIGSPHAHGKTPGYAPQKRKKKSKKKSKKSKRESRW